MPKSGQKMNEKRVSQAKNAYVKDFFQNVFFSNIFFFPCKMASFKKSELFFWFFTFFWHFSVCLKIEVASHIFTRWTHPGQKKKKKNFRKKKKIFFLQLILLYLFSLIFVFFRHFEPNSKLFEDRRRPVKCWESAPIVQTWGTYPNRRILTTGTY